VFGALDSTHNKLPSGTRNDAVYMPTVEIDVRRGEQICLTVFTATACTQPGIERRTDPFMVL
jgi:hypothetical protein